MERTEDNAHRVRNKPSTHADVRGGSQCFCDKLPGLNVTRGNMKSVVFLRMSLLKYTDKNNMSFIEERLLWGLARLYSEQHSSVVKEAVQ